MLDDWITVEETGDPAQVELVERRLRDGGLSVRRRSATAAGGATAIQVPTADLEAALDLLEELDDTAG